MQTFIILMLIISSFFNQSLSVDQIVDTKIIIETEHYAAYTPNELTEDMLVNRSGKLIIELVVGECLNENGDGKVLNFDNNNFWYISYAGIDGINKGDIVLTIMVYNPATHYTDDIIYRFDYVIR